MQLEDLHVVLKVAEFRSITAAAVSLDMSTATASAALIRVERKLGMKLFIRTTRQLRLSSEGERYLPECEKALYILKQAQLGAKEDSDDLDDELRIALSSDLGRNLIVPWLDEFMEKHPKLTLKAHLSDSKTDFYRDPVDFALRYGAVNDNHIYGFKVCDVPRLLCASPTYLAKYGIPESIEDLTQHNGLFYQLYDINHTQWIFRKDGKEIKVKMHGNRASNDGDLVRRWCVAGKGLAIKSCLDMSKDLLNGNLVTVLPEFKPHATELWILCPSRQSITPAIRKLREVLRINCAKLIAQLTENGIIEK